MSYTKMYFKRINEPENSTVGRGLALCTGDLGSISNVPYGTRILPGLVHEFRVRSKPQTLPGVTHKQTNKQTRINNF